jgi:hypothetical protein
MAAGSVLVTLRSVASGADGEEGMGEPTREMRTLPLCAHKGSEGESLMWIIHKVGATKIKKKSWGRWGHGKREKREREGKRKKWKKGKKIKEEREFRLWAQFEFSVIELVWFFACLSESQFLFNNLLILMVIRLSEFVETNRFVFFKLNR